MRLLPEHRVDEITPVTCALRAASQWHPNQRRYQSLIQLQYRWSRHGAFLEVMMPLSNTLLGIYNISGHRRWSGLHHMNLVLWTAELSWFRNPRGHGQLCIRICISDYFIISLVGLNLIRIHHSKIPLPVWTNSLKAFGKRAQLCVAGQVLQCSIPADAAILLPLLNGKIYLGSVSFLEGQAQCCNNPGGSPDAQMCLMN